MIEIPIVALPNQTFSIVLNEIQYNLAIYATDSIMAMDIVRDTTTLILGQRLEPFYPVLPYRYLNFLQGNFIFTTLNDEYPFWTQFNITQKMYYLAEGELYAGT